MSGANSDPAATADPGRLSERLHALIETNPAGEFRIRNLFESLAGRGQAALVVVISLPFCLPVPLLGLSTPFGLILAFIGLRIAFQRRPWLPRWLLDKPLRAETLAKLAARCVSLERRLHRWLLPRWPVFCRHPWGRFSHGLTIAVLAVLLALPLPIPMSNVACALPILLLGLGLLEDDGLFVALGYAGGWVTLALFVAVSWMGGLGLEHLWASWRPGGP